MKKIRGIIRTVIAAALVLSMCVPIKAEAYIYYSDEYNSYTRASVIEDKSSDGSVSYTNRVTGKTYKVYPDGRTEGDPDFNICGAKVLSRYMVQVGSNQDIKIAMPFNQKLGAFKITKGKKNLSGKIRFENIVRNHKESIIKDENGRYYYRDYLTGERIYVNDKNADIRTDRAVYKIRLYGKKKGKSRIEFPVENFNGNVIGKKTIDIDVTNDARVFTSVTFAGKELNLDINNMSNYIGSGKGKNEQKYVNFKKGRFKVKPNKYYQVHAIFVKRSAGYEQTDLQVNDVTGTQMTPVKKGADLNGDGDCNDIIYGIQESEEGYTYEKVRNGQVVKLSNVPDSYTNVYGTCDRHGAAANYEYRETSSSNLATTTFIIVYRDKRDGMFRVSNYVLHRRISKK
ncbi:hypothetical protein [Butyrivibrio sp. VCD2006]|uniref:hypothetical protein n=1 Tax=Butyrivibrio sp. VCD2006 TaxID=1280664 RepID=UPI0004151314|nr:hypothetical protein [Butyrivibrio sp. VCD2006]